MWYHEAVDRIAEINVGKYHGVLDELFVELGVVLEDVSAVEVDVREPLRVRLHASVSVISFG